MLGCSAGTSTLSGPFSGAATINSTGGAVTFNTAGTLTNSALNLSGGTVVFNTTAIGSGALNQTGGTLAGSADVTFAGASTWSGGAMSGTGRTIIAQGGTLAMSATSTTATLSRVLENRGMATLSTSTNLWIWNAGTFLNTANATFVASITSGTFTARGDGGTNLFQNDGAFRKQGAGTLQFTNNATAIAFNNSGATDVQAGTLSLLNGGASSGPFTIAADAALGLGGTHDLTTAPMNGTGNAIVQVVGSVTSAGTWNALGMNFFSGVSALSGAITATTTIQVAGGTASFDSSLSATSLLLTGGILRGSGDLTFGGASTWSGGVMSGTGRTIIAQGGTLAMSTTSTTTTLSRILENRGTATLSTSTNLWLWNAGTFLNTANATFVANIASGTFTARGEGGTNLFQNGGTFLKQGAGTLRFTTNATAITFNNTGAIDVQSGTLQATTALTQTAGSITLAGGNLTAPLNLQGGILSGVGTITGNVTNAATIRPAAASAGTLTITGTYTQTAVGTLDIDLGGLIPGSGHDRLAISGAATFAGSLQGSLIGGFTPNPGDFFDAITYGSRTGTLTIIPPAGHPLTPTYNPTALRLTR
ncbi:MAG: autotransporter-associated beta strand repeat-containing protein [Planctomycetes bacterium]|nr:autotransporter-associated beta strand repeat-containing protein [Planctomycetota bacterium]